MSRIQGFCWSAATASTSTLWSKGDLAMSGRIGAVIESARKSLIQAGRFLRRTLGGSGLAARARRSMYFLNWTEVAPRPAMMAKAKVALSAARREASEAAGSRSAFDGFSFLGLDIRRPRGGSLSLIGR